MTTAARDELIRRVLENEGGVADVGDGKGITRWGQTPGWLAQFDLRTPTNATEAAENYGAWLSLTGLARVIGETADPLAEAVIDFAVHAGHGAAIRALQQALRVKSDGVLGPQTLGVLAQADRRQIAARVIASRYVFLASITVNKPSNLRYLVGWMHRMATQVERLV